MTCVAVGGMAVGCFSTLDDVTTVDAARCRNRHRCPPGRMGDHVVDRRPGESHTSGVCVIHGSHGCRARYGVWSVATDSLAASTQHAGGEMGNRRTRNVGNSGGLHTPPAGHACCNASVRRLDADHERPQQLKAGTPSYLSTQRSISWLSVSSAAVTYTAAYNMNVLAQTSIWVYTVTVPVGFWLLLRGLRTARYSGPGVVPAPVPPVRTYHPALTRACSHYSATKSRDTVEGVTCRSPSIRITTPSGSLNL